MAEPVHPTAVVDPGARIHPAARIGAFSIVGGIETKSQGVFPLVVGADHSTYGRSLPVAIPAGTQDPPPVTLTFVIVLSPVFFSVTTTVTVAFASTLVPGETLLVVSVVAG